MKYSRKINTREEKKKKKNTGSSYSELLNAIHKYKVKDSMKQNFIWYNSKETKTLEEKKIKLKDSAKQNHL